MGIGERYDLAGVGGVGEDFLIAGHRGVENNLATAAALCANGDPLEQIPVLKGQYRGFFQRYAPVIGVERGHKKTEWVDPSPLSGAASHWIHPDNSQHST